MLRFFAGKNSLVFGAIVGVVLAVLAYLHLSTNNYESLRDTLSSYDVLGDTVASDFNTYPLVSLSNDRQITDSLKDGIEITYNNQNASTTFNNPEPERALNLSFPEQLNEPMSIMLPGDREITITHNTSDTYEYQLLTSDPVADELFDSGRSRQLGQDLPLSEEMSATSDPKYIKYSSEDSRTHTYFAYQKDQAKGYRNLKSWTIFDSGDGTEEQSYSFTNSHLHINDRGEAEVRYLPSKLNTNELEGKDVGQDLLARAQATLASEARKDITNQPPDIIIPNPFIIDSYGDRTDFEWTTSDNDSTLNVTVTAPTHAYPIALDPTLQFTAPGTSGEVDVIDGEVGSNEFGVSLSSGDLNGDGVTDLIVGAWAFNSYQGRTYIFYGGNITVKDAAQADVILTGESTGDYFGNTFTTGDLNSDGIDDLIVSSDRYNSNQGRAYVFYGGSMVSESATGADITLTGEATSNYFSISLTTGDLNNDGTSDLIVGGRGYSSSQGRAYVFYGGSMVSENATGADVILTGESTLNDFGSSLATADLNADGTVDLAVGARRYSSYQGRVYIFYGGSMVSENATGADVTLTGEATGNFFAHSLTSGDLNDDGTDDLIVGAYSYNSNQGRAYVFYGGSMVTENATGADVTLTGETTGDRFGLSLTTGDLHNDGATDLIVGALAYNSNQGRAYVFYGGSMVNENASGADVILTGEATSNSFGRTLTINDFNGDGKNDIAVGSRTYNSNQGRAYIFYSQNGLINTDDGISGESSGNEFGRAMTTGDWNNDGWPDLAVSAPEYSSGAGRVYVFYGGQSLDATAAGADVILSPEASTFDFADALTSGDLNEDGVDDLVVGAYNYSTATGRTYVFYGDNLITESASGADVILTGESTANNFGRAVAIADLNSDGINDLIVGADGYNSSQGRAYVFYGDNLTTENASGADVIFTGESTSDLFGYTLQVGDLNDDGVIDLVVNSYLYNSSQGRVYIFYGGTIVSENASAADVILTGESTSNRFGSALMIADLNNDGQSDLVVGAFLYNSSQGRSYVFYGGSIVTESASGADVILTGETTSQNYSITLATADLNTDGIDDLIIGASRYNTYQGRAYVYFGGTFSGTMEAATSSNLIITGDSANDDFGSSLLAMDYNRDGREDLIIGAPGYDNGGDTGRVYFYENKENFVQELQRPTYSDGLRVDLLAGYELKITGDTGSGFGNTTHMADLNGDGKEDLIVGAPTYNTNQGRVYIFYNDGDYTTSAGRADVILEGETSSRFGVSLEADDLDNDGKLDLVVGGTGYNSFQGRAYIFYGGNIRSGVASAADVVLTGENTGDAFGNSLITGDLDSDGSTDLVVGAAGYNSAQGRVYIFYGGSMVSESSGGADVTLTGESTGNLFGYIAYVADVNSDGLLDLITSATNYNSSQGRVYIFYGGSIISENASGADVTLTGEATSDDFGTAINAGDLNQDGANDLVVSSGGYSSDQGRVYIFYGGSIISENASGADILLTGESITNFFGGAVNSSSYQTLEIFDFNSDGVNDLAVSAPQADLNGLFSNEGKMYVFYGHNLATKNASVADIIIEGESSGDNFGQSITSGDLNNDGTIDLIISSESFNSDQGRVYMYTTNDYQITGEGTDSFLGSSLASGDFNNDGKTDLAVGATGYNSNQGRVYIFYGGNKTSTNASGADVILTGEATGSNFGTSLTTGDLNADGTDDLIIGAYGYNTNQGRAYVFYGGSMVSENATGADVILTGESSDDNFGIAVSTADLNADGAVDLIVSANNIGSVFPFLAGSGRVYIFYGSVISTGNASAADIILTGVTSAEIGLSLTTGDLNSDGTDDLIIGSYRAQGGIGSVAIVYGGSLVTGSLSADVTISGQETFDRFGEHVITGDLNNDGTDDLIAGVDGYNSGRGRVYVFYGGSISASNASESDVILDGEPSSNFGSSLAISDLNADGNNDLVVGAPGYSSFQGRTYIFYGNELRSENAGEASLIIDGESTSSGLGRALLATDINDNGVDDLIIGASGLDAPNDQGRVYVLMSEAGITTPATFRLRGDMQIRGSVRFGN